MVSLLSNVVQSYHDRMDENRFRIRNRIEQCCTIPGASWTFHFQYLEPSATFDRCTVTKSPTFTVEDRRQIQSYVNTVEGMSCEIVGDTLYLKIPVAKYQRDVPVVRIVVLVIAGVGVVAFSAVAYSWFTGRIN